jgi:hypothetical protein
MGRMERGVLGLGAVVLVLGLGAVGGAAPSTPTDGAVPESLPASLPDVAESPAAFAQRAAGGAGHRPPLRGEGSFRNALELLVLAVTCGIVVALYSAASSSGRGDRRVLMRIRRR